MDPQPVTFDGHLALLAYLVDARPRIVDSIALRLLNQRVPEPQRFGERRYVVAELERCLYSDVPSELRPFVGGLAAAHRAAGLEAVRLDQHTHELDPVELAARARLVWARTRWPGASGRAAYALTIWGVHLLRQMEYLSVRVWSEGEAQVPAALAALQSLLNRVNEALGPSALVRDARWLTQTAQGALTPALRPYFEIADHIDRSFDDADKLEVHRAGALLAGGHLRSQLRYRMLEFDQPVDAPDILAVTRNSNSMDVALLVRDLTDLLSAYGIACRTGRWEERRGLADAILQGMSADPELLLVRLDLLRPFTMLEDLFVDRGAGTEAPVRLTSMGQAHVAGLDRYASLLAESVAGLRDDAAHLNPSGTAYSPFGIIYGFCADLLSTMAQSRLVMQPQTRVSLEDLFVSATRLDDKEARARAWATLPRLEGERAPFIHDKTWGRQIFERLITALDLRAARSHEPNAVGGSGGRVWLVPAAGARQEAKASSERLDGAEFCFASDAGVPHTTLMSAAEIAAGRAEGRFLASVQYGGHWFAISKHVLTMAAAHGQDVVLRGVPEAAIDVLRLTCPDATVAAS